MNNQSLNLYLFEPTEIEIIESLIHKLQAQYDSIESDEFSTECALAAHQLPYRIRKKLNDFRNQRTNAGHILFQGFPVHQEQIGPTPKTWDAPWINPKILREEIFQCLLSSCVGDIFGWQTQENGRFLRHIVPIEKDKNEQLGGSSNVVLLWHIEEAFHPMRADLMTIMCYKNNEQACTNLVCLSDLEIPKSYWEILSQKRFLIEPDKSHFIENNQSQFWNIQDEHFKKIKKFLEHPEPVSVLQGRFGQETLLIDQAFMSALPCDNEAKQALDWLHKHMDERKKSIVMQKGDLLFIDNRITAHGRSVYKPQYGDHARWLRRVNLTTDLTKSYQWKKSQNARIIL